MTTLLPWGRTLLPGLLVRLEAAGAACSGPFPLVWLARGWWGPGTAGARALSLHITRTKSRRTRGTLWAIAGAVSLRTVELSGLRIRKIPKFCGCFPFPQLPPVTFGKELCGCSSLPAGLCLGLPRLLGSSKLGINQTFKNKPKIIPSG